MYLILIAAIATLMASLSIEFKAVKNTETPYELNQSAIEFNNYRMFVYAMDQYIKTNPFPSSSISTLGWSSIKNSPTTPISMMNNHIPDSWVVKGSSSNWVVCADLSPATISSIKARISMGKTNVFIPTNNHLVVGESDPAKALELSNICTS
jgi:hypothetical protein